MVELLLAAAVIIGIGYASARFLGFSEDDIANSEWGLGGPFMLGLFVTCLLLGLLGVVLSLLSLFG